MKGPKKIFRDMRKRLRGDFSYYASVLLKGSKVNTFEREEDARLFLESLEAHGYRFVGGVMDPSEGLTTLEKIHNRVKDTDMKIIGVIYNRPNLDDILFNQHADPERLDKEYLKPLDYRTDAFNFKKFFDDAEVRDSVGLALHALEQRALYFFVAGNGREIEAIVEHLDPSQKATYRWREYFRPDVKGEEGAIKQWEKLGEALELAIVKGKIDPFLYELSIEFFKRMGDTLTWDEYGRHSNPMVGELAATSLATILDHELNLVDISQLSYEYLMDLGILATKTAIALGDYDNMTDRSAYGVGFESDEALLYLMDHRVAKVSERLRTLSDYIEKSGNKNKGYLNEVAETFTGIFSDRAYNTLSALTTKGSDIQDNMQREALLNSHREDLRGEVKDVRRIVLELMNEAKKFYEDWHPIQLDPLFADAAEFVILADRYLAGYAPKSASHQ